MEDTPKEAERELFIDNLLVRIHFIIVMIRWTGLAPWEFEFLFPGSFTSTCLHKEAADCAAVRVWGSGLTIQGSGVRG